MEKAFTISLDITEHESDDDYKNVVVRIGEEGDQPFIAWMTACEYLMHETAKRSDAGFERALELLCDGAIKFRREK